MILLSVAHCMHSITLTFCNIPRSRKVAASLIYLIAKILKVEITPKLTFTVP